MLDIIKVILVKRAKTLLAMWNIIVTYVAGLLPDNYM